MGFGFLESNALLNFYRGRQLRKEWEGSLEGEFVRLRVGFKIRGPERLQQKVPPYCVGFIGSLGF